MTVYVDNAAIFAKVGRYNTTWFHLWADTENELHEFALKLGLRRSYFQGPPKHRIWHYDITASKRPLAIRLGAIEVEAGHLETHPASGQFRKLHESE